MSSLSSELVNEILLHLPAKSLKRFRCLSKTSCTEIDSSYFIKAHLKKSKERKIHHKLIIKPNERLSPYYTADFDYGIREANVMENFPFNDLSAKVKGICNGLFLIENRLEFCLWNPFIKQCRKLPSYPDQFLTTGVSVYGFGYDSARDDYKVIIISQSREDHKRFRVGVYSLRSNSWKKIEEDLCFDHPVIIGKAVFFDNALYWQWQSITSRDNILISNQVIGFDLANDKFFKLPLLSYLHPLDRYVSVFKVLDNKLHLVNYPSSSGRNLQVWLWVSGDQRDPLGYWKKAYELEEEGEEEVFIASDFIGFNEGRMFLFFEYGGKFFLYNIEKKTRERIVIQGLPPAQYYMIIDACCESLVSPFLL